MFQDKVPARKFKGYVCIKVHQAEEAAVEAVRAGKDEKSVVLVEDTQ